MYMYMGIYVTGVYMLKGYKWYKGVYIVSIQLILQLF